MTDVSYECVGFATQGVDRIVIVKISRLLQSLPMDIRGMYVVQMKQGVSGIEYIIYVRKVILLVNLNSINVKLQFLMQDI